MEQPSSPAKSYDESPPDIPSTSQQFPTNHQEFEARLIRHREEVPELVLQQISTSYRAQHAPRSARRDDYLADDTLSCVIVVLTFWIFVSVTLIMGIFGSEDILLSPYSSILLHPNHLLVHYIKVEKPKHEMVDPVLYGLHKLPPVRVNETWSESFNASIKPGYHKEWLYHLNEGSQINVSYNVPSSSSLLLIIAKGIDRLTEWLEDPSYPDDTLLWNVIHGSGTVSQNIFNPYDYYVAVGNLNSKDVEDIELKFSIKSSMYDMTDSYYKCNLTGGSCRLKLLFPGNTAAVLNTPGPQEMAGRGKLYVRVSYEPRWITYILGVGGMTLFMLWTYNLLKRIGSNNQDSTRANRTGNFGTERAPLLSSSGSSYDSGSQDDEESQEHFEEGSGKERSFGEGGKRSNSRQLCVVCFDGLKDCFFIPCGHCACCFACGTRIGEAAGTCPICRRKIKKVRRIYNV